MARRRRRPPDVSPTRRPDATPVASFFHPCPPAHAPPPGRRAPAPRRGSPRGPHTRQCPFLREQRGRGPPTGNVRRAFVTSPDQAAAIYLSAAGAPEARAGSRQGGEI